MVSPSGKTSGASFVIIGESSIMSSTVAEPTSRIVYISDVLTVIFSGTEIVGDVVSTTVIV